MVSSAQEVHADFEAMVNRFTQLKAYSYTITYEVFPNYVSRQAVEKATGTYKRMANQYYMNLMNVETLVNKNYSVSVDHDYQFISIEAVKNQKKDKGIAPFSIDSILKFYSKIEYKDEDGQYGRYKLFIDFSDYQQVDVVFNTATYQIRKLIFYYRNETAINSGMTTSKPRMEITIIDNGAENLSKADFDEKRFFTVVDGTIQLATKYRQYRLPNQPDL